jgi:hypothetical protein
LVVHGDRRCSEEVEIRFGNGKEFLNKSESHKMIHKCPELFILNCNASCIFKGRF